MWYAVSIPARAGERAGVRFASHGAVVDTPLLPYLGAFDQTFEGVWAPHRMHKSTHVVRCFSGLGPKGMWALYCLSFESLDSRN